MRLSACYIVKDEEKEMEKSLNSIKGLVDEIIVIDTGETAAIQRITATYKGRYFSYKWENDFAAARNFALDQAKGEWALFLDADEYVNQEEKTDIYQLISSEKDTTDVFLVKLVNIDEDEGKRNIDYFFAPRIFRISKDIRYKGKIHEQLLKQNKPITAVKVLPEKNICIYHTGYSSRKLLIKAKRNLGLLLDELKNSPKPEELYLYLAEAYDGIGDKENALKYAQLDIGLGRRNITFASRSYRLCLRILGEQNNPNAEEICRVAKRAVQTFPELPEFHAEYAQWLAEMFEYEAAIHEMQQAIKCSEADFLLEPTLFDADARQTAENLIEQWKQIQKKQQDLKISACVIVKNEAKEIGRWIANLRLCTDEQIIVDTGSVDNTIKIAEDSGIKVLPFKWEDDFSAAKNYAIENAMGDWIVFLDADEFFSPDTVNNVRKVIAREDIKGSEVDAILCPIINIDVDKNNVEISRFMNLRIFRNVPELRYYGNIHEGIRHNNSELRVFIERKFLHIYHTGYSSKRIEEKLQRNLKILQQDIAKNGEGIQHYRYLMDCYQGLGDHDKAIKYAKKHLQSNASSIGSESDIYRTLINSMVFVKAESAEIRKYIEEALARFPEMPDFYAYYAADYFRNKEFGNAKKYLLKALAVYNDRSITSIEASSFSYILSEVYSYLAEIYWQENQQELFMEYISLALQDNRYNCQAFAQLWRSMENDNFETKILTVDKYYDKTKKDIGFLVREIEKYSIDETYFHYAEYLRKIAGVFNEKAQLYRFLREGNINELYQQALQQSIYKVQLLTYTALKMETLPTGGNIENLLPNGIWSWIQAYHNGTVSADCDHDAYMAILPVVLQLGDKALCEKFLSLTSSWNAEEKIEICNILKQENHWEEIENILLSVLMTESSSDRLLHNLGEALFYCGQYDKAAMYFKQLLEMPAASKEAAIFLAWIEEKKKGLHNHENQYNYSIL